MSTADAEAIVIAGTHEIFVAPFGTALPDEVDDVLDAAFVSLGYTTPEGTKFTDSKTLGEVPTAQTFYPVRRFVTARDGGLEFTLLQWDKDTIELGFGGGEWAEPSPGSFTYDPPDPEQVDERSMVVDIVDGEVRSRILVRKGLVTSNTESSFTRTGPAVLPITFGVLGVDAVKPWRYMTDSPAIVIGS